MGEEYSLGVGGGAGGVGNIGVVAGLYGCDALFELGKAGLQEFFAHAAELAHIHFAFLQGKVVQHYDLFDCRALADDAAHFVDLAFGSDDEAGVGVVDTESEVEVRLQLEGEGHVGATGVQDAQFTEYPFVASF